MGQLNSDAIGATVNVSQEKEFHPKGKNAAKSARNECFDCTI